MTNEQFYSLKIAERRNLELAIDSARADLEEIRAPRSRQHKGMFPCLTLKPCPDEHFSDTGEFKVLEPFVSLLQSLDDQIALLKGNTD